MKKKENASAIVLAILMLAFFMALSLNMYYLTKKKGEKAAAKARGVEVTGEIDRGSSLGYYELFLADQYVSNGFFLDKDNPAVSANGYDNGTYSYSEPTSNADRYTQISEESSPQITATLAGIFLNNYNEYFASLWDSGVAGDALLISEKVDDMKVVSRNWLDPPDGKIKRLWEYSSDGDKMSVGGYRIDDSKTPFIDGVATAVSSGEKLESKMIAAGNGDHSLTVYYKKELTVPSSGGIEAGQYSITYEEDVNFTVSGSAISRINSDNGDQIIVEKMN